MNNNRWNTQYDKHLVKGEINNLPSLTIPNEAMSIREIMVRYTRGLPVDQKVPLYEEEQFLPDVRHMDLADVQTLKEQVAEDIENKKRKLKEEESVINEKKQQAKAEQIRKLREELFAHQPEDKNPMQNQKQPQ